MNSPEITPGQVHRAPQRGTLPVSPGCVLPDVPVLPVKVEDVLVDV